MELVYGLILDKGQKIAGLMNKYSKINFYFLFLTDSYNICK